MKRILSVLVIAFIVITASASSVLAIGAATGSSQISKVVSIPAGEVINKDFYTTAGDVVEISGTVNGDVLAAGGQILIDGTVNGDLLATGGSIVLSGNVSQDARLAGGQISVSGTVGRNLTVAGGNVELANNSSVEGGILAAGGNISLLSPVGGDVLAAAGNLVIANQIAGDLEAYVGQLRLTSKAKIDGDLTYTEDTAASIDREATVSGSTRVKAVPVAIEDAEQVQKPIRQFTQMLVRVRLAAHFFSFLAALLIGLIMLKLFPNYMKSTNQRIITKPWASLGLGFVTLVITPILAFTLVFTIIAMPIGLILMALYLIYLYLSKIYVSYWLGLAIKKQFGWKSNDYWSFIIGLAAFYTATIMPVLGGFIGFLALILGLGASIISDRDFYLNAYKKQLL